jgi:gamma-glutamyltranspeptidase/glutathione hydrolase
MLPARWLAADNLHAPFSIAAQDALRTWGIWPVRRERIRQETIGSVQAVVIDLATGEHRGAADPRREGTVIQVRPAPTSPQIMP